MPTGPGDEILDAIEKGTADSIISKKYGVNTDQLRLFKSLHYGLSSQKMGYDEINSYFPELNTYFQSKKPSPAITPEQAKELYPKPAEDPWTVKGKQSIETLNKVVAENDDVVENTIREHRYMTAKEQKLNEFAAGPRTDMPAAQALALQKQQYLEPEVKPQDIPVTKEEVAQRKAEIDSDENIKRDFIKKVAKKKPEKAAEIFKSVYQLDASERAKASEDKMREVQGNLERLEKGELKYDPATGTLIEPEGFFEGLITGAFQRNEQLRKYERYAGNEKDLLEKLEYDRTYFNPDKPVPVPSGTAGEIGQMAGMEWAPLLKGAGVGAAATLAGNPEAAPFVNAMINAPEYYKRSYWTALEQTYNQLRNEGKSEPEALKIAQAQAEDEGRLGAIEGAVSSAIGSRMGLKSLPKLNITNGFKNAAAKTLASTAKYAGEQTIDGVVDGMVAGYLQEQKNIAAGEKGIFRTEGEGIEENIKGEVTFALATGAMTKAGSVLVDPKVYKKLLYHLARQPKETFDAKLGEQVEGGQMTPEDAKEVAEKVEAQREIDKKVPDDIKDVSRQAMTEKIKERDELEQKKKEVDKALHPPLQERIDKLNDDILKHSTHKKPEQEDEEEVWANAQRDPDTAMQLRQLGYERIEIQKMTPDYADQLVEEQTHRDINPKYNKKPEDQVEEPEGQEQQPEAVESTEQQIPGAETISGLEGEPAPGITEIAQDQGAQLDIENEIEIKDEADIEKQLNSFKQKASGIATRIRSAKSGGKELYGGLLGVTVAVYDGMLETAAQVVEAGGTVADGIAEAIKYIKQNAPGINATDDEIIEAVEAEFIDNGLIMDLDQINAIKTIIKKTPKSVSDKKLQQLIVDSTGLPANKVQNIIQSIRMPPVPPPPSLVTSGLSPKDRGISLNKFKRLFDKNVNKKPNWFQRQWESFKNASAWLDNPYRFVTKIIEDIEKQYGKINKAIPLGRAFEKSAAGRAALKVEAFVREVISGKINGRDWGKLKGEKYNDFQKFLAAKRVIDRLNKQEEKRLAGEDVSRQTGNITRQDAEVQIEELQNKYGNLDDFNARAEALQRHMDGMLLNLVESGILSQEQYDQIKADNDFYAPFSVVQTKLYADQEKQPVGISGIVKRIKGIDYDIPTNKNQALGLLNDLAEALNASRISPEDYFVGATQILEDALNAGAITNAEYNAELSNLENPGFALNDILDAAANMIYRSEATALKNRMLQRLYSYKQYDTEGLFIQDVDGFEAKTLPDGTVKMIPKQLSAIKVEPGMAPIKVKIDGKDVFVAVNDQAARKLTAFNNFEVATWMKAANFINKIFRALVITLSPGFQVVNFAIDTIRTAMLSRYGPIAGKGLVQPVVNAAFYIPQYIEALLHSALGNLGAKTDTYKQWMESDSFSKGMFDNLFDSEKRIKEITQTGAKRILNNFLKLKFIDVPGSILEQTHKLATHQRGRSVEGLEPKMVTAMIASLINRNFQPSMSQQEMQDALDRLDYEVQNFAGSPNFPQTHNWLKLTSMFLQFFSARVKGEMTDYRRVANLFVGKGEGVKLSKQETAQIGLQFLSIAGAISAYAIYNNLEDEDEEQFNKIPPYHRDNYLNIPSGVFDWKDDDGNPVQLRDYIKVPLRGLTSTMNVMANSFVKYYKRKNPKEFKKAAQAFLGNASPINLSGNNERELGESSVSNLTPVFKFFLEYSFNRDTHSHRDLIPDQHGVRSMLQKYARGELKPYEVYTYKTPPWAIELSKYLYNELGIEINAITLDHMENTMGNPTELYDKAIEKRLRRSKMKYPVYTPKTPEK